MAEVAAAVSGGGAGGAPAGGGGAPPAPPSGGGGGAPAPSGSGGAPTTPPGGGSAPVPKFLERTVMRDGKSVTERVKEEALWASHGRETHLTRKIDEQQKAIAAAEQRAQEAAARNEKVMKFMREGGIRSLARDEKIDPIDYLARELEAAMKEEEANADPERRKLLQASRERDELKAKLSGIEQRNSQQQVMRAAQEELDRYSGMFQPALKAVKLPKNDVTMEAMLKAQSVAEQHGYELTPEQLAKETHRVFAEGVDGLCEGVEDDEEVLEMFPKLTRRVHAGLIKRHQRRVTESGAPRAIPPTRPEDRKVEAPVAEKGPRVLNSAAEDKAYFGNKKVLRSGI